MQKIILIAHNLRSCHNVGSLLRTADGLGVEHVHLTGYTPYPIQESDVRLPHLAQKIDRQIQKTALGAEHTVPWSHSDDVIPLIAILKADGYKVVALEQAKHSVKLPSFHADTPVAILVGREVEGVEAEVLAECDRIVEIPMVGKKESFNVAVAAAMALYHLAYIA
ncbi:MAG TPA: TrmH family RNA methyltransferase [Candidatus Saccharimonadales bacterium]|nr:TrmH family RNA methyltransferase [Candidatus Saccharimonadales bacterium]